MQVPRDLSGGLPERISGATLGVLDSIAEERDSSPRTSFLLLPPGGFTRFLSLLSIINHYDKRVFQEGEVVADSSSELCG